MNLGIASVTRDRGREWVAVLVVKLGPVPRDRWSVVAISTLAVIRDNVKRCVWGLGKHVCFAWRADGMGHTRLAVAVFSAQFRLAPRTDDLDGGLGFHHWSVSWASRGVSIPLRIVRRYQIISCYIRGGPGSGILGVVVGVDVSVIRAGDSYHP